MIINFLVNVVLLTIGAVLGQLPEIKTLPTFMGFDIDGALVHGVGNMYSFLGAFWPILYLFNGFLAIIGYHISKIALRFLIGNRIPS
jgi:hypothetical protein